MKLCSICKLVLPLADFCGGKNTYSCKPCMKEYKRKYHEKNRNKNSLRMKANHKLRMKDPEYRKKHANNNLPQEYHTKYYHDNKENCKASRDKYRAKPETKILRAAECRSRQAKKRNAQPSWANTKYITLFYKLARIEEARIGEPVHVDHIVPLQHELVCGLHCEFNLQLATANHNLEKSNKFQP